MDSTEKTLQILTNATGTNTELLNIKVSPGIGDIVLQLDVFNEQNEANKTSRQSSTNSSINLNSHLEVFQAILDQVAKTPHETTFLNILLHLLRIDPNEVLSATMWEVAEKLLHRVIQVTSFEDAQHLLKSTESHTFLCQYCGDKAKEKENSNINKIELPTTQPAPISSITSPLPPIPDLIPLPPPPATSGLPLPPPPLAVSSLPPPPPPPILEGGPPPPPPNLGNQPQQNTPKPRKKLKIFNWTKILPLRIINRSNCIWAIVANLHQYKCDYQMVEELFSAQIVNKTSKDELDSKDSGKVIHLLNSQRSLQINIFLSQFKGYNSEDIVQLIRCGNNKVMDLEKLKDLIKFLQKEEEIEILQNFNEDRQRLANAEKFLISLLDIPNYKFRIDCMVLKEEFALNMNSLVPSVEAILKAGKSLMDNETLPKILHIIITIGNFLNYGSFVGNATGITICSLNKIPDTKANKPNMHLLHFIAMEVEKYNPELLHFYNEFSFLANVSKMNIEQIDKDIKDLGIALSIIKTQIELPTTQDDIKQQMAEFLQDAEDKMTNLKSKFEKLKCLRITMANFFCEEEVKFKLDECFEIFHKFCEQFKQAVKENKERLELEIKEEKRRKLKEEQVAKRGIKGKNHTFPIKSSGRLSKNTLKDINCSLVQAEANNTNIVINSKKNEDDLMTYLEASNEEGLRNIACTRLAKRPTIPIVHFGRERDLCSVSLLASNNKNPIANKSILKTQNFDEQGKRNVIQKSWKRLMQKYTASKCQTPEITPNRQSLQILIRSNSTVDNRTGLLRKTPSVIKITKTPLPQNDTAFNFLPSEIINYQDANNSCEEQNFDKSKCHKSPNKVPLTLKIPKDSPENPHEISMPLLAQESSLELKHPRMSLKTIPRRQLSRRFSSINDEDLKKTLKSLRTPTIEGTNFCFSPVRDLPAKNFLAFSPTLAKPVANIFENKNGNLKDTVTCQDRKANIENKLDDLKLDIASVFQENEFKQNEISKERDFIGEKIEIPEAMNDSKVPFETNDKVLAERSSLKENRKKNEEENEKCPKIEVLSLNFNANSLQQKETVSKKSYSQHIVSKLQNKLKALSPSRSPPVENLSYYQSNNDITHIESVQTNEITNEINTKTENSINENPEMSKPSAEANNKQNFSQRLVNRLRSLSPKNFQNQGEANFKSYVNFKENKSTITNKGAKPKSEKKHRSSLTTDSSKQTNSYKEDMKIKRKSNITKENSSCKVNILHSNNFPDNSKTLKSSYTNQQRLSRQSLLSSRSSTSFLNTIHTKTNATSLKSSKSFGQRRSSLQYAKISTDEKVSSNTSKPNSTKISINSFTSPIQRRASLPSPLSSVISSKLTENIRSIKKIPTNNTKTKSIIKKHSLIDNRTKLTPLKTSINSQLPRRASLPLNRSSVTVSKVPQIRISMEKSINNNTNSKSLYEKDSLTNNNRANLKASTNSQLSRRASLPSTLKVLQNRNSIEKVKKNFLSTNNNIRNLTPLKTGTNLQLSRKASLSLSSSSVTVSKVPQNGTSIEKSTNNNINSFSKKYSLTTNKSNISNSKADTKVESKQTSQNGKAKLTDKRQSTSSLITCSNSLLRRASIPSSRSALNNEFKKGTERTSKQEAKTTSNFIQPRSSFSSNTTRRLIITSVNSLSSTQHLNSIGKSSNRISTSNSTQLRNSIGKSSTTTGPRTSTRKNNFTTQLRTSVENKTLSIDSEK